MIGLKQQVRKGTMNADDAILALTTRAADEADGKGRDRGRAQIRAMRSRTGRWLLRRWADGNDGGSINWKGE